MGWRYTFFPLAIGVGTEELTFYDNGGVNRGQQNEWWGFSAKNRMRGQQGVHVTSVSFDAVLNQV